MKVWMYWSVFIILLLTALICLFSLLLYFARNVMEKEEYAMMAHSIDQQVLESAQIPQTDSIEDPRLAIYGELSKRNADIVGWIRIEGTTIDYPVMQTPEDPNYYLRHDFDKEYSNLGTPYIQADCDLETSDNLILHGHHMLTGGMFSDLELYKEKSFWEKHPIIQFDTLAESADYEIFAVIKTTVYKENSFRYYEYIDFSKERIEDYVKACQDLALYETNIRPQHGDKLITLSTCEYSHENGRLLVVARKKTGGSK